MESSRIKNLSESTFRSGREKEHTMNGLQRMGSPTSVGEGKQMLEQRELLEYQLKLPTCPFHHQPIRFLCLRADCRSSGLGVCGTQECREMHAEPDADLIQLNIFNDLVRDGCSSFLLLSSKVRKYFQEIRESIIHKLDLTIERTLYLLDNAYMQEVPKLIRQKRHKDLSSEKLSNFVKIQLAEGSAMRSRMQTLRNGISTRITDREAGLEKVLSGRDYQKLLLTDLIRKEEPHGSVEVGNRIELTDLQSLIVNRKEQLDVVMRLLRENRAPGFSKMGLLFRASQNNFKAHAFHKSVDGKCPILLLVKTNSNRKIGAYVNCKLSQREEWISDASGLSFIFSIDREQSYRIKTDAPSRLKAAFGGLVGPQLGSGCDLYIADDCQMSKKSGANLGGSFRLPAHLQFNTPNSRSYLAGQQNFQVQQYEIYLLE